jgi:hypothetical protein
MLTTESITFGKYKGSTLGHMLKDRNYCKWLLEQDWFQNGYEYLFNRIKDYNPKIYFIKSQRGANPKEEEQYTPLDFLTNYTYFNMYSPEEVTLPLTEPEKICYQFYLDVIRELRERIYQRLENEEENPWNIKAPIKWLQKFEEKHGIPRQEFKDFLGAYDLPNIPYIIERIKKEGGIEYKGAQSFLIAKSRSEDQEKWWEKILKERYGEDLGTQFKYENCIFDFLNINTNTIFECKLGLKDFCAEQHLKYKLVLKKYRIIYLISKDCVIEIEKGQIYTTNKKKYEKYITLIPTLKNPSYLDEIIKDFSLVEIKDISTLFGIS